jgi:aryl-alcohol dehydrogenase-like predicted oxidoreductase
MQKRQLGRSALQVAPLVFGGNVFGWTIDEAVSFQLLDAFAASGFNCVDTADVYSRWAAGNSGGESEAIIGKWMKLRGNRDKIIVATKVGSDMGQGKNITKKYILTAANDSLKRLKTDYIDLYQTHFDDDVTPVEETLEAYAELIRAGKIRVIGASNLTPARLKASLEASVNHGYPRYESFQPHYNLVEREIFEKELEPICVEHGLGVINYWALAAGFLTGKYRTVADLSKSPRGSGIKKYLNARGLGILKALDEVAERYHSTPASVAIAWLIARPSVTAPIASATSIGQLDSLIAATKLELDAGAIKLLDAASAWR